MEINTNTQFDDPYAGYASCPDTQRAHLAFSPLNQSIWIKRSEQIIRECIRKLSTFNDFQTAFSFLANKRHDIATELKQRNDEGRTDYYGCFRQEGDHFRKMISAGDGEQYWKWQKKKVFQLVYKIIEPIKQLDMFGKISNIYENNFFTCIKESVIIDDRTADYYCITIKSPFVMNNNDIGFLSSIELYEFENKNFDTIRFEYTPLTRENQSVYYTIADYYFKQLLKWRIQEGINIFLNHAGHLSYLLSHLLLIKHGNAGVTEWLLRSVAFKQGVELGYFNHNEGISWDFKAILTPNKDEYVQWFIEKAFLNPKILSDNDRYQEFTYKTQL